MDAEIGCHRRLHYQAKFARLFWLILQGFIGVYNTFYGSAQTFAFDYSVVQSENMLGYCFVGNSFIRRLRIVGS